MMRMLCWVQSVAFLIILNVIIYAAKLQITPGSIFGSASAFLCSSKTVAVLLHKPVGYVTTHVDSVQPPRPTVYSLLPQDEFPIEQYHACGRLDIKTSGLLMITNDGWLVSHVTNPTLSYNNSGLISSESDPFHRGEARNHKITKLYKVLCMGYLSDLQLQKLRDGIDLKGGLGMSAPANVTLLQLIGMKKTELLIEITEGKNRQIRRMLHEVLFSTSSHILVILYTSIIQYNIYHFYINMHYYKKHQIISLMFAMGKMHVFRVIR